VKVLNRVKIPVATNSCFLVRSQRDPRRIEEARKILVDSNVSVAVTEIDIHRAWAEMSSLSYLNVRGFTDKRRSIAHAVASIYMLMPPVKAVRHDAQ
jgi:hypothetical protein